MNTGAAQALDPGIILILFYFLEPLGDKMVLFFRTISKKWFYFLEPLVLFFRTITGGA